MQLYEVIIKEHCAYQYWIEPTPTQRHTLARFAGARRYVWNWALARKIAHYQAFKQNLSFNDLCHELTILKQQPDTAWLQDIDSQLLQQALRDLDRAMNAFFEKRAGFPRFKARKRSRMTFRIPQRVTMQGRTVVVPKLGAIKLRYHRPLDGTPKSATFSCDATGHWCVSFVSEREQPNTPLPVPTDATTIGIDLGLTDVAVVSDGTRITPPRFYRRSERALKRAYRAVSRKKPTSRNRAKARRRVARLHQKVARQRRDWLHTHSTTLVQQADAICIEDLNVRGLARTKLAKSMHDAGWRMFREMLTYKTRWRRTHLVSIDRFYPSSKRCHRCGRINDALHRGDRVWTCPCGSTHDRDLNAAINIQHEGSRLLAAGHAARENACGHPRKTVTDGTGG